MNLEKFTDRAKGFLQAAQTVAIRMNHQRISPSHLLKALLDDEQGMAAQLPEGWVMQKDSEGLTALHWAVAAGHLDVVRNQMATKRP